MPIIQPSGAGSGSGGAGSWLAPGNGVPSVSLGSVGNYYLNSANRDVYTKLAVSAIPAFGTSAFTAAATTTSQALTMPSGITAGDLLVVLSSTIKSSVAAPAPTVTTPSGWTPFISKDLYEVSNCGSIYGFWKIAAGGDTVTIATDASSSLHAACFRYAGTHLTTPINVVSAGTTVNGGTTLSTAAVVTTSANCVVVSFGAVVANPTLPWTVPSGVTSRGNDNTAVGRLNGLQFGDAPASGTGTYGAYLWTPDNIGSQPHYGVTFAIAPPSSSGSWSRVGALAA